MVLLPTNLLNLCEQFHFALWSGKQITLSAAEEGKKPQQPLPTWSKGRLFIARRAGSYLWAEEQGAQTERGRKADAITVTDTPNILPLAVGNFQRFGRSKPVAKLGEEKNFLPGSTDRQLPEGMEWWQKGQKNGQQRGKSPVKPLWDYPQISHPATLISYREVSEEF